MTWFIGLKLNKIREILKFHLIPSNAIFFFFLIIILFFIFK